MSFLKDFLDIRNIKGPEFYKDFEKDNKQLYELEELHSKVRSEKKNTIMRDIINLKIGLEGERAVSYELKNSFIPMICLHDIRIDNAGYVAQMDYILITKYFIMVFETKKLNGDIVVNEAGEFIRRFKTKDGKVFKQEGMYSPISQNERHVRILDNFLKGNGLSKCIPIYSAVIMANPKAIINRSKAPYAIKNGIYKHDQITSMLNKLMKKHENDGHIFESKMIDIANFLMESNKEITYDFYGKYGLTNEDFDMDNLHKSIPFDENGNVFSENMKHSVECGNEEGVFDVMENVDSEKSVSEVEEIKAPCEDVKMVEDIATCEDSKGDEGLYEELRVYRYKRAMEEGNKPYFVFNNKTLEELVLKRPKSMEELMSIQGFGKVKCEKYGEGIIEIINK